LTRGSFSVPREWTDWADPSATDPLYLPLRFQGELLLELANLLEELTKPKQKD
jgi:hypothetical protein